MNAQLYIAPLGVAVIVAFFFYLSFKLDDEHWILRFILISIGLHLLLLVPKTFIDFNYNCYPVVNTSTVTTVGATSTVVNTYMDYCNTVLYSTPQILFKAYTVILIIYWIYIFLWVLNHFLGDTVMGFFKRKWK